MRGGIDVTRKTHIHASLTAQAIMVKLLTHSVRLPIPTDAQIEAGAPLATGFEDDVADQIRLPLSCSRTLNS